MEKYFVDCNQALTLKGLGFNEPCLASWNFYTNEFNYNPYPSTFSSDDVIQLPLKSQVFEWVRKEHKIHCSYGTTSDYREEVNGYCISNFIDGNRNYLHIDWEVGSYEEAESAAIDKLIELVKNK